MPNLILLLTVILLTSQSTAEQCESIFQDLPGVLLGYTLGVSPDPTNTETECVYKTMKGANRVEAIFDSLWNFNLTNYMEPVSFANMLVVDVSDAFVACKYSTMIRQVQLKFGTFSGLFSVVFTIVYSGITHDRLQIAAYDILETSDCFQYGYDIGVMISEILNYTSDNVYYNHIEKFAFDIPSKVNLI